MAFKSAVSGAGNRGREDWGLYQMFFIIACTLICNWTFLIQHSFRLLACSQTRPDVYYLTLHLSSLALIIVVVLCSILRFPLTCHSYTFATPLSSLFPHRNVVARLNYLCMNEALLTVEYFSLLIQVLGHSTSSSRVQTSTFNLSTSYVETRDFLFNKCSWKL